MGKRRRKASPAVEAGQAAATVGERVHGGPSPASEPRFQQPEWYRLTHKATVHAGSLHIARGDTITASQHATLPDRVQRFFEVER